MKAIHITFGFILLPVLLPAQTRNEQGNAGDQIEIKIKTKVDAFIHSKMDSLHIPGLALAVTSNGVVIYTKGYGFANLELNTPVNPESRFLIGSITKSFTAVALMMLWEDGLFKLDDHIGKYITDIPDHWKSLTVEQLLNHTSGIPSNIEPIFPCKFEFDCNHYTRQNYLQEVMCLPLEFKPGTVWKYSSTTGYGLLGMMIEKLSGATYYEFIRENIYKPLDMEQSSWIDYNAVVPNRVDGYYFKDGCFENSDRLDAIGEYASGGLISNVYDIIKFDNGLMTYKLLNKATLDHMLTNARLTDGTIVQSYGLGFGLTPYQGHRRFGHTGSAPGFSSSYCRFIDKNICVIVLTNRDADFSISKLSNEIGYFFLE